MRQVIAAARVFDGTTLHHGVDVVIEGGRFVGLAPAEGGVRMAGIVAPGFIDLQVNGGGGALLGRGDPDADLAALCEAQARLGATAVMATLITAPEVATRAVLAAAARARHPAFLGLHLEGPHLDPRRAGAHDPGLMRAMTDADVALYIAAAQAMRLMITLAPEAATGAQIAALAQAGVVVSLGHSDATEAEARAALAAGARGFTHLYNAMSPLTHRAPGMVGAALDGSGWAGIIPDGVHVAPAALRIAHRAMGGRLFAVSDAMAVAGTQAASFDLDGRLIRRAGGRLTLEDGTLAGADVSLPQAVGWMVGQAGLGVEDALAMVTRVPAAFMGLRTRGVIEPGARADLVWLGDDFTLKGVWIGGERV